MATRLDLIDRLKEIRKANVNEWGLSPEEERFARSIAKGKPLMEAYTDAFAIAGELTASHYEIAMEYFNRDSVQQRVAVLNDEATEKLVVNEDALKMHVLRGLVRESKDMKIAASARVAALVWLGKSVDLFGKNKNADDEDRKPDEIEAELRDRLHKALKLKPSA